MSESAIASCLGAYVTLQRGNTYKSALLGRPGPVLLGLGSIARNGGFKGENLKTYGGPSDPRILVQAGDIYVSLKDVTQSADLLGAVARVPDSILSGRLTQDTVKLEFKERTPPRDYIYWVLRTPEYRTYCKAHSTGTTNLGLAREDFFAFPVPPFTETRAMLVRLIQSIEDKIDLNRRLNETLEAMARAIFDNWFLRHRDRFPRQRVSEFIESSILLIGDGYRAKNNELGPPGLPFIRAGELNDGFHTTRADLLNERSIPAASQKISQSGDVAFTSKGTIGRFARVTDQTPRFVYSPQVCFWRAADTRRLRPSILYAWMVSEDLKDQIAAVAGQTDMAPYVSLRDQRAMTMPVFGPDQHHVAELIEPLLTLQSLNSVESRTLCETRDLLLPKLMSGEIRIREAEKAVAKAV